MYEEATKGKKYKGKRWIGGEKERNRRRERERVVQLVTRSRAGKEKKRKRGYETEEGRGGKAA